MLRQRTRMLQALVALSDAGATVAAFYLTYYFGGRLLEKVADLRTVLPLHQYLWILILALPMWWALLAVFGCYDLSPIERIVDMLRRMILPLLFGGAVIGAAIFFAKELQFSRRIIGGFFVLNVLLLIGTRVAMLAAAPRLLGAGGQIRRVLVIGCGQAAREFGATVERAGWGLDLAGYVVPPGEDRQECGPKCVGNLADLARLVDEGAVDDVVLAELTGDFAAMQFVIRTCEEVGAALHIPSDFFSASISRPHLEAFRGIRMLTFSTAPYNPIALGVKRGADIASALLLGAVASPFMLLFAVIIRATSPGAAIYRQKRSGLFGREFTMYKLRTMQVDAEQRLAQLQDNNEMSGPVFKMRSDPRVTTFGRFLRKHSLDELPQLWNVIKGDMSMIGPRPPLPDEVRRYERWQRRRLSMRPGLTCTWQVTDRNLATFDTWMEYDLQYIDHWSLWLDFKIALRTIPAVLRGTGM